MAKAVFHKEFRYRVKGKNLAFWIKAEPEQQSFPKYVIEAAVEAGCAEIVPPKRQVSKATGPQSGD